MLNVAIIGAGIVGLTSARTLLENGEFNITIFEKETDFGVHASGRNSGVLHCGIYYPNDTLKAKFCATGSQMMLEYAKSRGIEFNQSGKLILATNDKEMIGLKRVQNNAIDNNIQHQLVNGKEILEIESFANPDAIGIYCPTTAVINPKNVLLSLVDELRSRNVKLNLGAKVEVVHKNHIETSAGDFKFDYLINCAGSYADVYAKQQGLAKDLVLLPFKGRYLKLSKDDAHKIRANIYPVPNVDLPFLGVHLTKSIDGDVYIGPTAIPAFGRENYGGIEGMNLHESLPVFTNLLELYLRNTNNFRKLVHLEFGKYFDGNMIAAAEKLMPGILDCKIESTSKVGIRPQLVNTQTKQLEMDYKILKTNNSTHVLNAISPAFTCSFAFANQIIHETGLTS